MIEAQYVCMQAQTVKRIVTVTIFRIAANRVPHIGCMHPYLILTPCLKTEFHKRMLSCSSKSMEMSDSIFTAIIHWR